MANILIMPRQGNTVESCILTEWKVQEGDSVTEEMTVCSVETDKAAFEIPAGANGTVLKILRAAGDDVPVLEPIAVIGAAGEDWQTALGTISQKAPLPISRSRHPNAISPRARKLAEKEALPLDTAPGTGPGGRIIERDVKAALETRPALTAAAKALAPGLFPAEGSGIGGRITTADISASPAPRPPMKGVRKIIADRMHRSLAETAQFTINSSAPVSRLQEIRSGMNSSAGEPGISKISITDLVLFAVSRVLKRFPYMNSHKTGDTIVTFEQVHLGLAVDTPRGLMVPVIRNADLLSLAQISSEAKRLATACRNGSVQPDELSGSTFTVTNLGGLGITHFTPILNIPEVAILGICSIELKPVAVVGSSPPVSYEPFIGFSLTVNHQAVDGAPAARFLNALGEAVANIGLLINNHQM